MTGALSLYRSISRDDQMTQNISDSAPTSYHTQSGVVGGCSPRITAYQNKDTQRRVYLILRLLSIETEQEQGEVRHCGFKRRFPRQGEKRRETRRGWTGTEQGWTSVSGHGVSGFFCQLNADVRGGGATARHSLVAPGLKRVRPGFRQKT